MRTKILATAAAVLLSTQALADTIEATFTGTIRGIAPSFDTTTGYQLNPYTTPFGEKPADRCKRRPNTSSSFQP